jgi:capsid portal protein
VCHVINPDIHQEIYGMPEYFAGLLSANLAHSADKFRKLSTTTGRMPAVLSTSAAQWLTGKAENLKKTDRHPRGGAFKNILLSAPGVGKDAVQILPFSQISAKDEFVGVKSSTRDDMLAAHRAAAADGRHPGRQRIIRRRREGGESIRSQRADAGDGSDEAC